MTKTAIFTIVTKNYIGLANVLMQSIADNNKVPTCESFIFLADEIENIDDLKIKSDHIVACKKEVIDDNNLWISSAFKYNVTEFCTFLKPYCIEHLYASGFTNVIYLDPDIYVFQNLGALINNLDKYAVILTPHVTNENSCEKNPDFPELAFANNGIFNLGFIAVNNSEKARRLICWWKRMVTDNGYMEASEGIATDQKWMDFAPAFLGDALLVERQPGYNAAFWNIQEREFIETADGVFAKERGVDTADLFPLYFFHFSALYYPDIYDFGKSKYSVDFVTLFPDLKIIFKIYDKHISRFNEYSALKYSYSVYDNNAPISYLNRRLYRRLIENDFRLTTQINPFKSTGPLYSTLKKYKLLTAVNTLQISRKAAPPVNINKRENNLSYTFFRTITKMLGNKVVDKLINVGKSVGKAEGHASWLKKDLYKRLNNGQ